MLARAASVALLAGCAVQRPPARPPPPRPPPHVAAAPVLHAPTRYLASRWSFSVTERACVARTEHPELGFSVTIGPAHGIRLTLTDAHSHRSEPAQLGFSGGSGHWLVPARRTGRVVAASLPLTDRGLSDVLALLNGGQLFARTVDGSLPGLNVPDAGVAGRDWFGCPRARLRAAESAAAG